MPSMLCLFLTRCDLLRMESWLPRSGVTDLSLLGVPVALRLLLGVLSADTAVSLRSDRRVTIAPSALLLRNQTRWLAYTNRDCPSFDRLRL